MAVKQPQTMTDSQLEELLALLQKQQGYYDSIWEITQQEEEKLRKGRPLTETVNLLKKKKILVTCVEEIDTMIRPLRALWSKQQGSNPLADAIKALIKTLDQTLKNTLEQDKKNQRLMQQAISRLQHQKSQALET